MRIDYLSSDILLFRGDSQAALATAFRDGERALLVDGLASPYDAIDLRDYLETTLGKRVEQMVLTDPDGGHAAALALFPHAQVRREPALVAWGRHTLELFALPGARCGALSVDAPEADLLFVADSMVGNIALLGGLTPEQADDTLARLQDRGRARVVPRHAGAACVRALGNARAYLARLRERVQALRGAHGASQAAQAIAAIGLDELLVPGEFATPLERHWHADNLRQVVARGLFPARAQPARAARSRSQACCETLASVLKAMLGRLAERA